MEREFNALVSFDELLNERFLRRQRRVAVALILGAVPGGLLIWFLYPELEAYVGMYSDIGWMIRGGYFFVAALLSLVTREYTGRVPGHVSLDSEEDEAEIYSSAILVGMGAGAIAGSTGVVVFLLTGSPLDLAMSILAAGMFFVEYFPHRPARNEPGTGDFTPGH